MNFECKELKIDDDSCFGCTIEFCDTIEEYDINQSIEQQLNYSGKYLLIQRSYPEEKNEIDWYTIESSEVDFNFNQKDSMYVTLYPDKFEIYCSGEKMVIGLNLPDKEFTQLVKVLRSRFKKKVVFLNI